MSRYLNHHESVVAGEADRLVTTIDDRTTAWAGQIPSCIGVRPCEGATGATDDIYTCEAAQHTIARP